MSLEAFVGAFYKKFPGVEMRGLLLYVSRRLASGSTAELGIILSLLRVSGGYGFADCEGGTMASLSELQLDGFSGSLQLIRETSNFGVVEKTSSRSCENLRAVLQDGDRGVTLLVLLAQAKFRVIFQASRGGRGGGGEGLDGDSGKIKLIGSLYSSCQRVLRLLLSFITDNSGDVQRHVRGESCGKELATLNAIESYANSLPTLVKLHNDYRVDTATAFMICRYVT